MGSYFLIFSMIDHTNGHGRGPLGSHSPKINKSEMHRPVSRKVRATKKSNAKFQHKESHGKRPRKIKRQDLPYKKGLYKKFQIKGPRKNWPRNKNSNLIYIEFLG